MLCELLFFISSPPLPPHPLSRPKRQEMGKDAVGPAQIVLRKVLLNINLPYVKSIRKTYYTLDMSFLGYSKMIFNFNKKREIAIWTEKVVCLEKTLVLNSFKLLSFISRP